MSDTAATAPRLNKVSELTCLSNQWPRELLDKALSETAVAEQARAAQQGRILPLADVKERVTMNWLDAMYPAGNA